MAFLYYFISLLLLIGQVHTVLASDDLLQKGSIKELLQTYNQGNLTSSCIQNYSSTRFIASTTPVLKNDLTRPHSIKPSLKDQNHPPEHACSQTMKPLHKLLILPPSFLPFETSHALINKRKVWETLYSHFGQSRQLKIVSWEKMYHLKTETISENREAKEKQEENLKLARLTDADAYLTMLIDEQKIKIQVYFTQDAHLLWEEEVHFSPNYDNIFSMLDQNMNIMVENFLKSFPYHGIQILDPFWQKTIFEKDFQNLAKIDVGSDSSIEEGDFIFWIKICRINKSPLFKDGGKTHILAKGKVLKKERGVLLANITHYNANLNDWKEKLHEGTLVVSADEKKISSLVANQDNQLRPVKSNADKTKSRLTIATGIFSILVLLAVLL